MGRRTAAAGDSAPAGDAPPIFFVRPQKENAPRPVEKKTCSAGRPAQAQPSCRRRGKVGSPLRQSETETRRPWGNLHSPGQSGIPSATLPAAAHASSKSSQRQRKKKQLNASTTPTQEHHPPRDGSCKLAEDLSVPEGQAKSEQAPIRRPPCARRATAPECAQAPFSLPPGAAHSLFGQDQKENGGRIPCGSRGFFYPSSVS